MRLWLWMTMAVDVVWMKCGRSVAEGGDRDAFGGVAPQEPRHRCTRPRHVLVGVEVERIHAVYARFRVPGVSRLPPMPRAGGMFALLPLDSHLISAHRDADKKTIGGCAMDVARAGEEGEEGTGRTGWLMVAPPMPKHA